MYPQIVHPQSVTFSSSMEYVIYENILDVDFAFKITEFTHKK